MQAAPKTEVTEKKELRKLREEHALMQMRLQNEDLAKRTLESNLQDLSATNHRLALELEDYKKLLEQTRDAPKAALYIDTAKKETSDESIHSLHSIHSQTAGSSSQGSMFGTLRRGMSKRRSKIDMTGFSSSEKDLQISSQILEGHIKVPKEGRIRNGWMKKYLVVNDFMIMLIDKEKEKVFLNDGKVIADVRWGIFICKEASEANVHAKKEELPLIFMIQGKPVAPNLPEVFCFFFFCLLPQPH